jgi:Helix-turn-helix domain
MTSEESVEERAPSPAERPGAANLAVSADAEAGSGASADPGGADGRERVDLTDPKAMRALAHPLRWALLEALAQAGTLTATQASEMLAESPANCAFHLRTLAKYGFVEEAGGGRGRERPWRRTYDTLSWGRTPDDPGTAIAADALDQVWIDRLLTRARRSLTSTTSWPQDLHNALGTSSSRLYVRPADARRLYAMISEAFTQLADDPEIASRRHPDRRPADALPVEFVLLGYPVLDSPLVPEADADAGGAAAGQAPGTGPEPPEMSDPRGTMGRAR